MTTPHRSRVVVITGAATGIGYAMAQAFGQNGDRVVVSDRTIETVSNAISTLGEAGIEATGVTADVRVPNQVEHLFNLTANQVGIPSVVIANAGIYPNTPFLKVAVDEWDRVIDTNLKGVFLTCQSAARQMVASRVPGHLIVVSSGAANTALHGWSHYCSSKAAVGMLTRSMALELGEFGIRANAILPGYVDVDEGGSHLSQSYREAARTANPLRQSVSASDIAQFAVMLASPQASRVNGSAIPVDNGAGAGRMGTRPVDADFADLHDFATPSTETNT